MNRITERKKVRRNESLIEAMLLVTSIITPWYLQSN